MSETEPKYYTKSEVNRMLEVVEREKRELFSEYEQMQKENDYLRKTNDLILQVASISSEMNTFLLKEIQALRN